MDRSWWVVNETEALSGDQFSRFGGPHDDCRSRRLSVASDALKFWSGLGVTGFCREDRVEL